MSRIVYEDGDVSISTFVGPANAGADRKRWQLGVGRDIVVLTRSQWYALGSFFCFDMTCEHPVHTNCGKTCWHPGKEDE